MARITYMNDVEDLVAFARHHFTESPQGRSGIRSRLMMPFIAGASAGLGLWVLGGTPKLQSSQVLGLVKSGAIVAVATLPLVFLLPGFLRWNVTRQVRRIYSTGKHRGIIGRHTLEATEAGLGETTEVNESLASWVSVGEVVETPHHVLIYMGPQQGHVVPRATAIGPLDEFVAEVRLRREQARIGETSRT